MANILGVNYKNITMTADEAGERIDNGKFTFDEVCSTDGHSYYCLENDEDVARIERNTKELGVSENFSRSVFGYDDELCDDEMKNLLAFYIIVNELDSCDLHTVLSDIANTYMTTDDIYTYE